jgi:hypothetical protein
LAGSASGVFSLFAASDPQYGPLIGLPRGLAYALVKDGSLSAPWVRERTSVANMAVAG